EAAAYEGLAFESGRDVRGFVSTVRLLLGIVHMLQGRCVEGGTELRQAGRSRTRQREPGLSAATLAWALTQEGDPSGADVLQAETPRLPEHGKTPTPAAWASLSYLVPTLALLGRRDDAAALRDWTEDLVATGVQLYFSVTMFATAAGVAAACAKEWT